MPELEADVDVQEDAISNELEAYFDDPDAEVESTDDTEAEVEESEESEESKEEESTANDDESEETEEAETQVEESEDESVEQKQEEDTTSEKLEEGLKDKPKKGEPDPELAREAFKRREAERKLRETQERQEAEQLQRYLDDAQDDQEELVKRQMEVNTYVLQKERSAVLSEKLDVAMQKAVLDLGLKEMDAPTTDFITRRLEEFDATRVVRDKRGNILDVRGDVYQYLKEEMDSISQFRSSGAREQTKKKAVEKTRTVLKPSRTPKEEPKDLGLEAFAEEANSW